MYTPHHYYATNFCVFNTLFEKYGIKFTFCVNTGCRQSTVRRTNHRLAYRNVLAAVGWYSLLETDCLIPSNRKGQTTLNRLSSSEKHALCSNTLMRRSVKSVRSIFPGSSQVPRQHTARHKSRRRPHRRSRSYPMCSSKSSRRDKLQSG